MKLGIKERLFANREIDPVTGCWIWQGNRGGRGYGKIWLNGKKVSVSRASAIVFLGFDPNKPEIKACHSCDNPPCFNPDHLFPGTSKDNTRDAVQKKRHTGTSMTHCKRGHPLSGDNLYRVGAGRKCKACNRLAAQRYRSKLVA